MMRRRFFLWTKLLALTLLCFSLVACTDGDEKESETGGLQTTNTMNQADGEDPVDGETELSTQDSKPALEAGSKSNSEAVEASQQEAEDVMATTGTSFKRDPIMESGFLKAKGKNIYNQNNDLVQLKGTNIGGYLFQEFWMTPMKPSSNIKDEYGIYSYLTETYGEETMREMIGIYQDSYFTEADFDRCQALGMNLIRLPFWYRNLVDSEGKVLPDWYDRFDWFIEEAGKRGIYVLLDFHGAPGSQNGSDHSGFDGEDDKEGASAFFFGDQDQVLKNQELFYDLWVMIAKRYKGNPVVAGYDLLNEPYCTYRYSSPLGAAKLHEILWQVYDEAYQRIRLEDPDHMIFMEATWDPIDLPNPDKYGWENVVYEYHNYLYDDYDNEHGGQIRNMEKKVKAIRAAGYNVPSMLGEFSYFNNLEAWDEGLKLLTQEGLSYTTWTYKVVPHFGNWGLYHHKNIGEMNLEVLSPEAIRKMWTKVGDVTENKGLIEVVVPYFRQEYVLYKE